MSAFQFNSIRFKEKILITPDPYEIPVEKSHGFAIDR